MKTLSVSLWFNHTHLASMTAKCLQIKIKALSLYYLVRTDQIKITNI